MKTYFGRRQPDGICTVVVQHQGDKQLEPLALRLDLDNHSPTGFEWGYAGSGPAQLALALLADALDDDTEAARLHQAYKWRVVCGLPRPGFTLTSDEVKRVAAEIKLAAPD